MKVLRKTTKGYIYDKRIFWGVMGLSIVLLVYLIFLNGWSVKYNIYVECTGSKKCENPYLDGVCAGVLCDIDCSEEWCNWKYLEPGTYGKKPSSLIKYFPFLLIAGVGLGLLLNHYVHNRGKKFHLELNLSKKTLDKMKKVGEKVGEKFEKDEER